MQTQVPDRVGRHRVADQINPRRVDVGVLRGVEDRLKNSVHANEARAVKLAQVEQRHQHDRVGMARQFVGDPTGVDVGDLIGVGRRVG